MSFWILIGVGVFNAGNVDAQRRSLETWSELPLHLREKFKELSPTAGHVFAGCSTDHSKETNAWWVGYTMSKHRAPNRIKTPGLADMGWNVTEYPHGYQHEEQACEYRLKRGVLVNGCPGESDQACIEGVCKKIPVVAYRGGHLMKLLAYVVSSILVDFLGIHYVLVREASALPADPMNFTRQFCTSTDNSGSKPITMPELIDVELNSLYQRPESMIKNFVDPPTCMESLGGVGSQVWSGMYAYFAPKQWESYGIPNIAEMVPGSPLYLDMFDNSIYERLPVTPNQLKSIAKHCNRFDVLHPDWVFVSLGYGCVFLPDYCCPGGGNTSQARLDCLAQLQAGTKRRCSQIYHSRPGDSLGELEAMILTYKLPYFVQYVGFKGLAALLTSPPETSIVIFLQNPTISSPNFNLSAVTTVADVRESLWRRVQFPTDVEHCEGRFYPMSPFTKHRCDTKSTIINKFVSGWFRKAFPAGTLVLKRFRLTLDDLQELVDADMHGKPSPGVDQLSDRWMTMYQTGICGWFRAKIDGIRRSAVGNCTRADQPVRDGYCQCHPGLMPADGSEDDREPFCKSCPPDSYCPGRGRKPSHVRECGLPASTTDAGRRRRAMGPASPKDCRCEPGYGWPKDQAKENFTCIPCSPGLYKDKALATFCVQPCEGGSWSEHGATSHLNCTCSHGTFRENTEPVACRSCTPINGAHCTGGTAPPKADFGYMHIVHDNGTMITPEFYECWNGGGGRRQCVGDNQCAEGQTGWLCAQCKKGYAKPYFGDVCAKCVGHFTWTTFFLITCLLTMLSVFYSSIMAENAVDHSVVVSILFKIAMHHAFVTTPGVRIEPSLSFFAYSPSYFFYYIHYTLACILDEMNINEPIDRGLALILIGPLWVFVSLCYCWIAYSIEFKRRKKLIAECQSKANAAAELIQVVEGMVELRLVDQVGDRQRMYNIRNELKAFIEDLVYKSRINYIWRTVLYPKELQAGSHCPYFAVFLNDSATMYTVWTVWCHSLIGPKLICSLIYWYPYKDANSDEKGEAYSFMSVNPDLKMWSGTMLWKWFVIGFVSIVFLLLVPMYAFLKIFQGWMDKKLVNRSMCQRWGFLYHGLELKYPQVLFESLLITMRFMVGILNEGALSDVEGLISMYRILAVFAFVCHVIAAPYEKAGGGVLNLLMGASILVWLMTAQTFEVEHSIYQTKDDHNFHILIMCVGVLALLFWLLLLSTIISEVSRYVYKEVELLRDRDECNTDAGKFLEAIKHDRHIGFNCGYGTLGKLLYKHQKRIRKNGLIFTVACSNRDRHNENTAAKHIETTSELVLSEPEYRVPEWRARSCWSIFSGMMMSTLGGGSNHSHHRDNENLERASIQEVQAIRSEKSRKNTLKAVETLVGPSATRPVKSVNKSTDSEYTHRTFEFVDPRDMVTASMKAELDESKMVIKRQYNTTDRTALANLLMQALNIMVRDHGLQKVPFCYVEYVFADCCFLMCQTRNMEMRTREEVFEFIWKHPAGKEEGITELFIANKGTPSLTTGKRSDRLKALRFGAHLFNTGYANTGAEAGPEFMLDKRKSENYLKCIREGLTIHELERYVTNLKCQEPSYTTLAIQGYAEQVESMKKPVINTEGIRETASQTVRDGDATVQTERVRDSQTNTSMVELHRMLGEAEEAKNNMREAVKERLKALADKDKKEEKREKSAKEREMAEIIKDQEALSKANDAKTEEQLRRGIEEHELKMKAVSKSATEGKEKRAAAAAKAEQAEFFEKEEDEWKEFNILRGRIDAWLIDNSRLQAASAGLGLRLTPNMMDKDGLTCAPWGSIVEGNPFDDDWIETSTARGARFLPRRVNGHHVVVPCDAKFLYDSMREEALAADREAQILEEECARLLKGGSK